MTGRIRVLAVALGVSALITVAACTQAPDNEAGSPNSAEQAPAAAGGAVLPGGSPYSKVLIIAEENKEFGRIIGSADAPYINKLAATYGNSRNMGAGYAASCPSLTAYILLSTGLTHGLCD